MFLQNWKLKQPWDTVTPIRMAKIPNTNNTKCWQRCSTIRTLIHWWWEYKMAEPLWKTGSFFQSYKPGLPCDPMIMLLGIYELLTYVYIKKLHIGIHGCFIYICQKLEAVKMSFILGKQTVVHPYNVWVNEYYSVIKKNEPLNQKRYDWNYMIPQKRQNNRDI